MTGLFFHILGMIIPIDEPIFFRGVCLTTNQPSTHTILPGMSNWRPQVAVICDSASQVFRSPNFQYSWPIGHLDVDSACGHQKRFVWMCLAHWYALMTSECWKQFRWLLLASRRNKQTFVLYVYFVLLYVVIICYYVMLIILICRRMFQTCFTGGQRSKGQISFACR